MLGVSSYASEVRSFGFAPAPLDELSLRNGVAKFDHEQCSMTAEETDYILTALEYFFPMLSDNSQLSTEAEVLALVREHGDKAAGDPWRAMRCQKKVQALEKFGLEQIEEYYRGHTVVLGSTLKDELRPEGKDARLFRPVDVSGYVEGSRLFHHQNCYITETGRSPVFCRFVVPGQDVVRMFASLRAMHGRNFAADGSQWDAHFPLIVAQILCEFRIRAGLPRDRVERYYSMMYNGYTLVTSEVFRLIGQPSGHFNTSVDNSLGHVVLMALHACRVGLSIQEFVRQVRFYACGDDLVWSCVTNDFDPSVLQETYNSVGVYLEFQSFESLPVDELVFVGVKPCKRVLDGREYDLFSLVSPRSFATLHIHKKKTVGDPLMRLAKYAALAILWFADVDKYDLAKTMFQQELAQSVRKNRLSAFDQNVKGLWLAMNEAVLLEAYMGWERQPAASAVRLSFGPSWNSRGGLNELCHRLCGVSLGLGIQCSVRLRRERTGVSKLCTPQTR